MEYRRLGGMQVSAVSLGGWINFEVGKLPSDLTRQTVESAYEQGINFFDLADVYGKGSAETLMGQMLRRYPRHSLVVSTKVCIPMSEDVNDRGLSRKHIMESIHKSLARLQMDYVDIYFCHRPDPDTPLEESARAMNDLVRQGKILYWGTSKWSAAELRALYAICERYQLQKPQVEQAEYSMLVRQRVQKEIMPLCQAQGMGLVAYSPLAMGLLTGKYDEGIPDESRFAKEPWAKGRFLPALEVVRQLKGVADSLGISRAQLALAWALQSVSSVIIGASNPQQILDNVAAVNIGLGAEVMAKIEGIIADVELG